MQIKDDGFVDVDKLEETFLAKADSSWKPVASAAVDKCRAEMASKIIKRALLSVFLNFFSIQRLISPRRASANSPTCTSCTASSAKSAW